MDERQLLAQIYKKIASKPRTKKEIIDWLQKKETPETLQQTILAKLIYLRLLNDLEYAQAFIRTRTLLKPKPKRVLRMELLKKGVSDEHITQALESTEVDEVAGAKDIFSRNQWRWRQLSEKEKQTKASEFLMRKGYSWSVVKEVV